MTKVNNQAKTKLEDYFLYNRPQLLLKILWLSKHFLGYIVGFPFSMTINSGSHKEILLSSLKGMITDSSSKFAEDFSLDFFGLTKEKYTQIADEHSKRFTIYFLLGSIPFFVGIFLLIYFTLKFFDNSFSLPILYTVYGISFLTTQVIYSRLLVRIIEYLIPETLCIMQIINLNLELRRDDVTYRRDVKSMILFRMSYLSRVTTLIPWHYSIGKSVSQQWIQQHFQNMAYYILERRRWLVAPNKATIDNLRKNFYDLAYYYFTEEYGSWEWQFFQMPAEVIKQTRFQKIKKISVRFIGITLPLIIMALYILFPAKLPNSNAEINKNLPYIFIAWLLVSLDITLKLGVIESLVKLITGLKDLSK